MSSSILVVVAHHRGSPPIAVRSRFIPSRVRDFTVPSGRPSLSEIFDCDSPSKYMSSITWRCSSGRLLERGADGPALLGEPELVHDVVGEVGLDHRVREL